MSSAVQEFVKKQSHIDKRRKFLRPALFAVGSTLCKVEASGLERIPDSGPAILMMNHISFMDPIVFTAIVKNRFVISMAKAETMENWFTRWLVHLWGNFPIRRNEVDRVALDSAIELLRNDQFVLIAPEGTRNSNGLKEARSGIAYIAYKSNAIVVPSAICEAQRWKNHIKRLQRAYAKVTIGRPFQFHLPEGTRLTRTIRNQMMREAMYQLALAIPEDYAELRGIYQDIENATTEFLMFK